MVKNIFQRKPSKLDGPINKVLDDMTVYGPDSPEYLNLMNHLERLTKMQRHERRSVSPDTMAIVVGNLLGILTIVAYEQKHVMVSKGLGMILRTKQTTQ